MIDAEPQIHVGIIEGAGRIAGTFQGPFDDGTGKRVTGGFSASRSGDKVVVTDERGGRIAEAGSVAFRPVENGKVLLHDVTIGIQFHWQRKEDEAFEGAIRFVAGPSGGVTVINDVGVEAYLASVISSEMSASSPLELLRAHAITSRSWLVAMLERERSAKGRPSKAKRGTESASEIVRWYDREDHADFDVCADDHCQRYQGVSKIQSPAAVEAVRATRGMMLIHDGAVCDARYYKSCGGRTELFGAAWEDADVPYLASISDAPHEHPPIGSEADAQRWILGSPEAFCNTTDGDILRQVLPSFDQETTDFYRWTVRYERPELEALLKLKSGIDFGRLLEITPVARGASGRITRLRIAGTKRVVTVGKELEIRKWLSPSHLYSSAFVVQPERDVEGVPLAFTLRGAGWGHGVGLCQIGAAVMATKGYTAEQIVLHYFRGAEVRQVYL